MDRPKPKQQRSDSAKLVHKGVLFDVYQWEQELYDGSTATFETLKRIDTTSIIPITSDGKLIITRQEQPGVEPFVGTLGGRVDPGEAPLVTAKRELLEESGYEAGSITLWSAKQFSSKIDWVIYTFIARDLRKVSNVNVDAGEKIELLEVTIDELIDLSRQDTFRDIDLSLEIHRALDGKEKEKAFRDVFKP